MTQNMYKIGMLGSSKVGKTSIVVKYALNRFENMYDPTIHDAYRTTVRVNERPYSVQIIDCGDIMPDSVITDVNGFVCVYSIDSIETLSALGKKIHSVQQLRNDLETPIIVVGNKLDLFNQRQISVTEGVLFAHMNGTEYVETSAVLGYNIDYALSQLMSKILTHEGIPEKYGCICNIL
jgi:small GTP-binding protein